MRASLPSQHDHHHQQEAPYLTLSIGQAASASSTRRPPNEPSDHGTLTSLLAHRAHHSPKHQVAVGFPSCTGTSCQTWSYADVHTRSRRLGSALRSELGLVSSSTTTAAADKEARPAPIAVLGPSGPAFLLHVVACWQLGYAVMPIAIGTVGAGIANLLKLTDCIHLLVHPSERAVAEEAIALLSAQGTINLVEWHAIIAFFDDDGEDEDDKERYDDAIFQPVREVQPSDDLVIFHSSGSTGNPKPIRQLHRFWTQSLTHAPGTAQAAYTTTPLFHGGLSDLLRAWQAHAPIFFFAWHEGRPATTGHVVSSVRACTMPVAYFLSVPFLLEMLVQDEGGVAMLRRMRLVSTGGAPLSSAVGDAMVKQHGIRLVSRLGSSECGFLMSSWRDFPTDPNWSWLRLTDPHSAAWLHFEPRPDEGGLFELVVRPEWPNKVVANRPDGGYATSDLYERHGEREGWWRYVRRADDSLVLVNGKKVASSPIEAALTSSGLLTDALVFGANRPFLGAIVLPTPTLQTATPEQVLHHLRPLLARINAAQAQHAHLDAGMVHIGSPALFASLPRSSKGTLQRGLALGSGPLRGVVEGLYDRFERGETEEASVASCPRARLRGAELRALVRGVVSDVLGRGRSEDGDGDAIDDGADFFAAGVDSVKAMRIRARLLSRLDLGGRRLSSNVLYEQGNIDRLCAFLEDEGAPGPDSTADDIEKTAQDILKRYAPSPTTSHQTKPTLPVRAPQAHAPATILLTGGTGALGSRILAHLLAHSSPAEVGAIYCHARAATAAAADDDERAAEERILRALEARRVKGDRETWARRLRCFARLDGGGRGGGGGGLEALSRAENLVVIHCAWTVNFALSLPSFEESCIRPLHKLLNLYYTSPSPRRFVFCSSLASILAAAPPSSSSLLEDTPSTSIRDAGRTGYGQSKWVAERLCAEFFASSQGSRQQEGQQGGGGGGARRDGGQMVIARVGQLCGDTEHGIWNEEEAYPLLVRTAVEVGCLPRSGPSIDWLPVDIAAAALVEVALQASPASSPSPSSPSPSSPSSSASASSTPTPTPTYLHIATPPHVPRPRWPVFLAWLHQAGLEFEEVDKEEWLRAVRAAGTRVRGRALVDGIWSELPDDTPTNTNDEDPNSLTITTSIRIRISTTAAEQASRALAEARTVDAALCARFVRAWRGSGFLPPG